MLFAPLVSKQWILIVVEFVCMNAIWLIFVQISNWILLFHFVVVDCRCRRGYQSLLHKSQGNSWHGYGRDRPIIDWLPRSDCSCRCTTQTWNDPWWSIQHQRFYCQGTVTVSLPLDIVLRKYTIFHPTSTLLLSRFILIYCIYSTYPLNTPYHHTFSNTFSMYTRASLKLVPNTVPRLCSSSSPTPSTPPCLSSQR